MHFICFLCDPYFVCEQEAMNLRLLSKCDNKKLMGTREEKGEVSLFVNKDG